MKLIFKKMMFLSILALFFNPVLEAQKYKSTKSLLQDFDAIAQTNSTKVKAHNLAYSFSGQKIKIYEFGTETQNNLKKKPAIFIMANPEGDLPIASQAALKLANELLKDGHLEKFTWYIMPVLNADALNRFFDTPLNFDARNSRPFNDDMDDLSDEDGPEDINGDGFITKMRVLDPLGIWIPEEADARFMRRANVAKGEKGLYTIYTEGIDNDKDGLYNEDPFGGVNSGINFPNLFKTHGATSGAWPGSEPEVYELMKFIYAHPEIAATFTFGSTDYCIQAPQGGRKGNADLNNIRIPRRFADAFGADPNRTYSMEEVMEMAKPMVPDGIELTPAMVAGFLGLGPAVNPLDEDLKFYNELNKQYKDFLKAKGYEAERLAPQKEKEGSFELWSYYHLGIPTFSMNFFTLPKAKKATKEQNPAFTVEQLEKMSNAEFVALGEEKITAFLKENNAPERFSAAKLIEMANAGQFTPAQMAGMLKQIPKTEKEGELDEATKAFIAYDKGVLKGTGFINWTPFDHPTLGKVEIGGEKAYVRTTPSFEEAEKLIDIQLPWIFNIADKLPKLSILKTEVEAISEEIFKLTIWVQNENYLPFPTAMGVRNSQPAPAILLIEGKNVQFVDGKSRTPINQIDGLKTVKHSYLIQAKKGTSLSLNLESKFAGNDSKSLILK